MKKLIDIINIEEVTECHTLQVQLKLNRKLLIRYKQSLGEFKERVSDNFNVMNQLSKGIHHMVQKQSKNRKKHSQIDYFANAGVNLFGCAHTSFEKIASFYGRVQKHIVTSQCSIGKFLSDLKKAEIKNRQAFEKQVKNYASDCHPDTTSLLFMLGFTAPEKVQKKEDSVKQQALIEEANKYSAFLSQQLAEMSCLKEEALNISREYYEGARDFWVGCLDEGAGKIQALEVDERELQKMADETGNITDRSNTSVNKNQLQKDD